MPNPSPFVYNPGAGIAPSYKGARVYAFAPGQNPYAVAPTYGAMTPTSDIVYGNNPAASTAPKPGSGIPSALTGGKPLDMGNIEQTALFAPLGGTPSSSRTVKIGGANVPFKIFEDAARPLAEYGVTPESVYEYARPEANRGKYVSPSQAASTKASDNEWAKEAFRVGVLTGDKWRDDLIWREHWAFMQGISGRDPLLTGHPESVQRLMGRAEEIAKSQQSYDQYDSGGGGGGQSSQQPVAPQTQQGYQYTGAPIGLDSPQTRPLLSFSAGSGAGTGGGLNQVTPTEY